jgi:NADH-quinone oxidoreductase subunit K
MVSEAGLAQVALALAALLIALGGYGMTASRNLLRQLISAEVLFNGVLLAVLVILAPVGAYAVALALLLVTVVTGEIVVAMAVVAGLYRRVRSFEADAIEEEGV